MLTVAFATENDRYDSEVYRFLIEQILGVPVAAWKTEIRFGGWKRVLHLAELYLIQAADRGIRHAVLRGEDALQKLRERRSFRLFEEQLAGWKP